MFKRIQNILNTFMEGKDNIGVILYASYLAFMILSVILVFRILYIDFIYKPEPELRTYLTPNIIERDIEPLRGSIFAKDGRLLAMSTPQYQIYMDCSIRKEAFRKSKTPKKLEKEWLEKARKLSEGLSKIYKDKSASQYYNDIVNGRRRGNRFMKIGGQIGLETMKKVKELPLFNEGQYKGGIIIQKFDSRRYPYGSLARRTIGYVKDNQKSNGNNLVGLEGRFNNKLHGEEGYEYLRVSDNKQYIPYLGKPSKDAVDGLDLYTTLDVDIQDIADKSFRSHLANEPLIEGGSVIVLEASTGAIRAMVNLMRNPHTERLEESYNNAIGRVREPGSVFKTATLMSVLEDGYIKSLEETIPTNHGVLKGFKPDRHIPDYERKSNTDRISILEGFKKSSNYVLRYLAIHNYSKNPKKFIHNLYEYKLGEAFDFDLTGLKSPTIPSPDSPTWSGTDLGSIAIGYSTTITPLHIATFYNAIANKGKMMKPYLVESFKKYGNVKERHGKSVLNASICSKSTADTLTRALTYVIEEGTARRLKNAKCQVAGKTGTSWIVLDASENDGREGKYKDKYGRKRTTATFAGFFPAEAPKYTVVVSIFSKLTSKTFYGGTIPALTVKDIVNNIYTLEPQWSNVIDKGKGKVPSPLKNK